MAKLTTKERNSLPDKDFALPKERKYPIEDASHARDAKARAAQEVKKGHLTAKQKQTIDHKADKVLKDDKH